MTRPGSRVQHFCPIQQSKKLWLSAGCVYNQINQFVQRRPCNLIVVATSDKEASGGQLPRRQWCAK